MQTAGCKVAENSPGGSLIKAFLGFFFCSFCFWLSKDKPDLFVGGLGGGAAGLFQALQVAIVVILLLSSLFRPVILYLSANCWPAPNMIMISFRAFIVNLIRDPPSSLILSCVLRGTPFDRPTPDSGPFPLLRLGDFNGSCQHSEDTVVSSCLAISTLDSLRGKDGLRSLSGQAGDWGWGGGQHVH